jgi:hypothetical protein
MHVAAQGRGPVKKDFVVAGSLNLKGEVAPDAVERARTPDVGAQAGRYKIEVPEFAALAPAVGCADFDRKPCRFDILPAAHLRKHMRNGRCLALSDMIAGETLSLQNQHAQTGVVLL